MQQFSFILDNFLRGKAIYAPIRRVLNILFSISIASFLFQQYYFKYQWLDISDYKGILNFFITGKFIVPLILFLIAHFVTYIISFVFFSLTINKKSTKLIHSLVKSKIKKSDLNKMTTKVNKLAKDKLSSKVELSWVVKAYLILKTSVDVEQWQRAEKFFKKQQENIGKNFLLLTKAIVAMSVYLVTVDHFGITLYLVSIVLVVAGLIFLWYCYLALEVLPTLVRKVDSEMQNHLKSLDVTIDQQVLQ